MPIHIEQNPGASFLSCASLTFSRRREPISTSQVENSFSLEKISGAASFCPSEVSCAIRNKNAGNAQQNARANALANMTLHNVIMQAVYINNNKHGQYDIF